MENIIKFAIECNSMYGIIALVVVFLGFGLLGYTTYKIIQLILPYIYKIVCKYCNTVKKYKEVHSKVGVKDISIETDLHR